MNPGTATTDLKASFLFFWRPSLSRFFPRTDSQQSQECHKLINTACSFSVITPLYRNGNLKSLLAPQDTGVRQEGKVFVFTFTSLCSLVTAELTDTMMKAATLLHSAGFAASSQRLWPVWLLLPAWASPLGPLNGSWLVFKSVQEVHEWCWGSSTSSEGGNLGHLLITVSTVQKIPGGKAVVSQVTMELAE